MEVRVLEAGEDGVVGRVHDDCPFGLPIDLLHGTDGDDVPTIDQH